MASRPIGLPGFSSGGGESAHKMYGIEFGIVSDRAKDEGDHGNYIEIMVQMPRLPNQPVIPCRWVSPIAGENRGFYWTPEPGDEVAVAFERGEQNRGVIIGTLWNKKAKVPEPELTDKGKTLAWNKENTTRMLVTNSGHKVFFDDKENQERITIEDKSGKRLLTFDTANKKIILFEDEGDLEIKVKKKISIECEDFHIKASKSFKVETKDIDTKSSSATKMDGGNKIEAKASRIDLNP